MPHTLILPAGGHCRRVYYVDSGPVPESDDYHTLVLVHGAAFNGNIFKRLIAIAAKYNLRLVIPNRRGYRHSEDYTNKEIAQLKFHDKTFFETMAAEAVYFWLWVVESLNIPKRSQDGKRGGVSILGFGMGSSYILSALGWPGAIPATTYQKLEPYIRNFVLYGEKKSLVHYIDAALMTWGFPYPKGKYDPLHDPTIMPMEEKIRHSLLWKTSYWSHPPGVFKAPMVEALSDTHMGDSPSLHNMTEEEVADSVEFTVALKCDVGFQDYNEKHRNQLKEQANNALYNEELAKQILPQLKIVCITAHRSCWYSVLGYSMALEKYQRLVGEGKAIRRTTFSIFHGMNHLGLWDEPDRFLRSLNKAMAAEN